MSSWTDASPTETNFLVLPKHHRDTAQVALRYEGRVDILCRFPVASSSETQTLESFQQPPWTENMSTARDCQLQRRSGNTAPDFQVRTAPIPDCTTNPPTLRNTTDRPNNRMKSSSPPPLHHPPTHPPIHPPPRPSSFTTVRRSQ